jgi:hypothetical protein
MSEGVHYSLEHHDATEPTVHQVVGVEGDTKEGDQGVVPSCEDEEGNLPACQ